MQLSKNNLKDEHIEIKIKQETKKFIKKTISCSASKALIIFADRTAKMGNTKYEILKKQKSNLRKLHNMKTLPKTVVFGGNSIINFTLTQFVLIHSRLLQK